LTDNELGELHVSARHNAKWNIDRYKLENVAGVVRTRLLSPPDAWPGRIILWGHDRGGPFSILEGNHRMLAYAYDTYAAARPSLNIEVYVGLSDSHCYWHFADPPHQLGSDLCKTDVQLDVIDDWLINRSKD
jgi:hypothetical protein